MKIYRIVDFMIMLVSECFCFFSWVLYMFIYADMPKSIKDIDGELVILLFILDLLVLVFLLYKIFFVSKKVVGKGFIWKTRYNIGFIILAFINMFLWMLCIENLCPPFYESMELKILEEIIIITNCILSLLLMISLFVSAYRRNKTVTQTQEDGSLV